MIIVGTAQVNASTGKVELVAPLGFGTARGIRLSNFTGDTLTLTNISGVDQSQEYLAPQTQMVYATANIGAIPTIIGYSYPAEQVAANLLVEWSTEPDSDFIGTYPSSLPTGITASYGTTLVNSLPANTTLSNAPLDIGIVPTSYAYVAIDLPPYQSQGIAPQIIIHVYESTNASGCDVWVLAALQSTQTTTVTIPVQVSHIGANLNVVFAGANATGYGHGAIRVYSSASVLNVPLGYCDILTDGIQYISIGAGYSNSVIDFVIAANSGTNYPYPAGLTKYLGWCDLTIVENGASAFVPIAKAALVTAFGYLSAGNAVPNETNVLAVYNNANATKIHDTNGNRDFYYAPVGSASMSFVSNTRLFMIPDGGYPAGYAGTLTVTARPHRSPYSTTDVF